ncbi:cyclodeaminase/cyclohydrolase family protein [Haloplanus pelagicus]|uniref:cyclodeaminase/cyclohydrolase family protein n=1 Tax=Haloplanus pelagicus TaxID=2949995 RepID=UPI00203E38B7|nr:cyclodeaminase/cyclohydrolase family protein [Haloplanus sp. HW8-1]
MTSNARSIDRFLDEIASESVAPAGGTAAAVAGGLGAALCEMVCIHTVGRGADAAGLADVRDELRTQRGHLLDLAETDAAVVDELFGASGTEARPESGAGIERAVGVPLTTARACLTVLELATDVTATGTPTAVADAATGVLLVDAALRASLLTARHNLDRIPDPSFVDEIERRAAEIEARADRAEKRAMRHVEQR